MATTRSTAPLVWIDCEMTGLDTSKDTILEICCYVTSPTLELLEPSGWSAFIHHTQAQLDAADMSEWCLSTHTNSGLLSAVVDATQAMSASEAAAQLLDYVTKLAPERGQALLAGNTVWADRGFLEKEPWSKVLGHLHYRCADVSAVKEFARRWATEEQLSRVPVKRLGHRAREDILESIAEARAYRELFFGGSGQGA